MEAKDTIMGTMRLLEELEKASDEVPRGPAQLCLVQAEITWDIAYKEGQKVRITSEIEVSMGFWLEEKLEGKLRGRGCYNLAEDFLNKTLQLTQPGLEKYTTCPFCKEDDFDLPGLKNHLAWYCRVYQEVENLSF